MAESTLKPENAQEQHLRERAPHQRSQEDAADSTTIDTQSRDHMDAFDDGVKPMKVNHHWGPKPETERALFYGLAIVSWCFQIAAGGVGGYYRGRSTAFNATIVVHLALNAGAWFQTVTAMLQRASWVRDDEDVEERRSFLIFAVRLNQLMGPTALISLPIFIQAYARRSYLEHLAYWLIFLLSFVLNTVFSVINAYNNIVWENDRMLEEEDVVYRQTRLAVLGIPN